MSDNYEPRSGVGVVETHGVDFIPEPDRRSRPANLASVLLGQGLTFAVIVIGWLPIAYGLGWWSALSSIVVGVVVGSVIVAPISLVGPRTGTNGPVSSGAYFGVVGRVIGTLLSIFVAVGFAAIAVWTSGQAVLEGAHDLVGVSTSDGAYAVVYALISLTTIVVAVFGHASVVAVQKFMIPTVGVLLVVGIVVFAPRFDAGYGGGTYLLGSFGATWTLAMVTAASLPVSLAPFVNDYTRYMPRRTSGAALMGATIGGTVVGVGLPLVFGAFTATTFAAPAGPYIQGLVSAAPGWYVVPIVLVGLLGGCGQAAFALYGTGLDFSSLVPRLKRVPATITLSMIAVALVYLGSFVWDATDTVSAFITIFTIFLMPWTMIVIVGHVSRRGYYRPDDLQVFNRGERGGAYWFSRGINARALAAYLPAVVIGVLFTNTSLVVGPWANAAGGVDLSFVSSGVVAAVLYALLILIVPEPASVRPRPAGEGPVGTSASGPVPDVSEVA